MTTAVIGTRKPGIHYDETALRARKVLTRGILQNHEMMHLVSNNGSPVIKEIPRKIYGGTSLSTTILRRAGLLDRLEGGEGQDLWAIWPYPCRRRAARCAGKARLG